MVVSAKRAGCKPALTESTDPLRFTMTPALPTFSFPHGLVAGQVRRLQTCATGICGPISIHHDTRVADVLISAWPRCWPSAQVANLRYRGQELRRGCIERPAIYPACAIIPPPYGRCASLPLLIPPRRRARLRGAAGACALSAVRRGLLGLGRRRSLHSRPAAASP